MAKVFICSLLLMLIAGITQSGNFPGKELKSSPPEKPEGTAVIITGAAARIPQEAALLEHLYDEGLLNDVRFIAGASSGALNTVILNGILSGKYSWERYLNVLFNIRNKDIYKMEGKKLPVDTGPLRNFLKRIVNDSLGFLRIGDLPIASAISITDVEKLNLVKKNFRMSNLKINPESDPNLDLVEILMASTSFPIAFPKAIIHNSPTLPQRPFIDGGVHEDHIPFRGMLDYIRFCGKSFEKVIIVSRKSDKKPELSEELASVGINDKGLLDKLGISLDEILFKGFVRGLKALEKEDPELAERTYVYFPAFDQNFLLLNFDNLKEQYDVTRKWALDHDPVPLKQFLLNIKEE